jgi:hypothetical protein
MEEKRPDPQNQPEPPKVPAPTQHDQMRKDLPKKKVAEALEDFDGDEG